MFVGDFVTPLIRFGRLASYYGCPDLLLKMESAQPISHTFKDRGALAAVEDAIENRASVVVAGTCGNMGVAVAGACAKAGLHCLVILSDEAPAATKAMISASASQVWLVQERFDAIDAELQMLSKAIPTMACINTTLNRSFHNGFRTLLREVLAQVDPSLRYAVIVPTADGTLLSSCWDEYQDYCTNHTDPIPIRFVLVQPSGCAPLVRAIQERKPLQEWRTGQTAVLPLGVRHPTLHGSAAIHAVLASQGTAVAVPEEAIPEHARSLASLEGIASDLVGGTLVGAIAELASQKWFAEDEVPIGLFTGNGLIGYSDLQNNPSPPTPLPEVRGALRDLMIRFQSEEHEHARL